jgi:hypothetical protein
MPPRSSSGQVAASATGVRHPLAPVTHVVVEILQRHDQVRQQHAGRLRAAADAALSVNRGHDRQEVAVGSGKNARSPKVYRCELRRVLRPDGALVLSRLHPTGDWLEPRPVPEAAKIDPADYERLCREPVGFMAFRLRPAT